MRWPIAQQKEFIRFHYETLLPVNNPQLQEHQMQLLDRSTIARNDINERAYVRVFIAPDIDTPLNFNRFFVTSLRKNMYFKKFPEYLHKIVNVCYLSSETTKSWLHDRDNLFHAKLTSNRILNFSALYRNCMCLTRNTSSFVIIKR